MPSLMGEINVIARCARLFRNDRLQKYGLHGTMDSIILNVCREPGISQETLARKICIDKSNVARKVAQLEADGFITREASCEDKRVQCIYPTDKAKEINEEIRNALREWREYVTQDLSEQEIELLTKGLEKMYDKARLYTEEREDKE